MVVPISTLLTPSAQTNNIFSSIPVSLVTYHYVLKVALRNDVANCFLERL